ncbi:hypothetical protein HRbin36_01792 [bacterium HR36]|nr:hypothetical protein HRbin36_01792 [bacterium HR36]
MSRSWWRRWQQRFSEDALSRQLAPFRQKLAVPFLWLLGKSQTGKTSVIRYLTGATDAEIGKGFRATTKHSRVYYFPSEAAPLLAFLDTRSPQEADYYDPRQDLAQFEQQAHALLVTVRCSDLALDPLLAVLRQVRSAEPSRPVILLITCLHEAYPGQQHVEPYFFGTSAEQSLVPEPLRRLLEAHRQRFADLIDTLLPLDLTPSEEGFNDPNYGGPALKETLLRFLPEIYKQSFVQLEEAQKTLTSWHERRALPYILAYSSLAAAAATFPLPWIDMLVLPAIQVRLVYHLAELYGQSLTGGRFRELAASLGLGLLVRQTVREAAKLIPGLGSVAAATLAGTSTYALGRAFCYYYSAVLRGHVPKADELRRFYQQELRLAEKLWKQPANSNPGDKA